MKILCTADLHIGRRSSRLPDDINSNSLSCAYRWGRIVRYAIGEKADVVLISGDLIDQENKHFEALGPLEAGFSQLKEAGIQTVVVSGNHDYDVLPRAISHLHHDSVTLLGSGGRWERKRIETQSGEVVNIDGWSFPQERIHDNPLNTYNLEPEGSIPSIGMVHGDLDVPDSRYAPLTTADLRTAGPSLWVLGHQHLPRLIDNGMGKMILYPGSPQAMDPGPGERGVHGVWMANVSKKGCSLKHVALSSVRYEEISIDVTDVSESNTLEDVIIREIHEHLPALSENAPELRFLSLRIILEGRTAYQRGIEDLIANIQSDLRLSSGSVEVHIERIINSTRLTLSEDRLASIVEATGVPSILGRLLFDVRKEGKIDDSHPLKEKLDNVVNQIVRANLYQGIPESRLRPSDDEVAQIVMQQTEVLLDELLSQLEVA